MESWFLCKIGTVRAQFPEQQTTIRVKERCGLDVDPELALHDGQELRKAQQQNNKQRSV